MSVKRRMCMPRVPGQDGRGGLVLCKRTLNVRTSKGIREGQLIRLAGQGGSRIGALGLQDMVRWIRTYT